VGLLYFYRNMSCYLTLTSYCPVDPGLLLSTILPLMDKHGAADINAINFVLLYQTKIMKYIYLALLAILLAGCNKKGATITGTAHGLNVRLTN
jgi:hypothetical protein